MSLRTKVGIIGAGPAGLMLGNILLEHGIDCLVLERHSRAYVEQRARAGAIEHRAVRALQEHGLGDRMLREGTPHGACEFRLDGQRYILDYAELAGGSVHYVYPQQELVKDLIAGFLRRGGDIRFDTEVTGILDDARLEFTEDGRQQLLHCDLVAGCDGFHGVSRSVLPAGAATVSQYRHGDGWVAVLADAPPSTEKIIYALHPDGFAGHMLRSPTVSRFYLQCPAGDPIAHWPAERIWSELRQRLGTHDDWTLTEGPILDKQVLDLRSYVCEPMQFGNLYLVGDAAHVLPPAGGKGMNLALGDARELALGIVDHCHRGSDDRLRAYSQTRLAAVWRDQEFSHSFLRLLHGTDPTSYTHRLRRTVVEQLTSRTARAVAFAENYVGR